MSRMLRPYLFLVVVTVVLATAATSFPTTLPSAQAFTPAPNQCQAELDALNAAIAALGAEQASLAIAVEDERLAATAHAVCESQTPGMCGTELSDWEAAYELLTLVQAAVVSANGDVQVANADYYGRLYNY
mgnify:CR=1 FL=1|jgi:hypothetical protein